MPNHAHFARVRLCGYKPCRPGRKVRVDYSWFVSPYLAASTTATRLCVDPISRANGVFGIWLGHGPWWGDGFEWRPSMVEARASRGIGAPLTVLASTYLLDSAI